MSLDFTITPAAGSVGGGPIIILKHGIQNIANYTTNIFDGNAWFGYRTFRSNNVWGFIEPAGVYGRLAKFWGKTHRVLVIKGSISVKQATVAAAYPLFETLLNALESMQNDQFEFQITGPRTFGPATCDSVATDFLGPNTGSHLFFTLMFGSLEG